MEKKIATIERTKALTAQYGLFANKGYGQNFLISPWVTEKIVQTAKITKADSVIEIGPGLGGLTQALCLSAKNVLAVEIDKKLFDLLTKELSGYDNLELVQGDILKVDLDKLAMAAGKTQAVKVCANLPYYITTPILMKLLEERIAVASMTVMMQKEVAERITAQPGTKNYGALTLAVAYYAQAVVAFDVPPSNFWPQPNVVSSVVHLDILKTPPVAVKNPAMMFNIIKAAFGQRRKTLVNSVFNQCNLTLSKTELQEKLKHMGFDINIRGEALSLAAFAAISDGLSEG